VGCIGRSKSCSSKYLERITKEITKTIGVLRGLVVLTHGKIKINKKKVEAVKIQIKTKKTRY